MYKTIAAMLLVAALPACVATYGRVREPAPRERSAFLEPLERTNALRNEVRPAGPPAARTDIRTDVRRVDARALRRQILHYVNVERRRAGSPPLRFDRDLTRAAVRYSRELSRRREIEHVSHTPGLRTFRDRIHAAGARARVAGENLARLTASERSLPWRVVRAWMRSPGHRRNLLDPIFTRTGIGVVLGDDGIWYVTQYYATPS